MTLDDVLGKSLLEALKWLSDLIIKSLCFQCETWREWFIRQMSIKTSRKTHWSVRFITKNTSGFHFTPKSKVKMKNRTFCMKKSNLFCILTLLSWQLTLICCSTKSFIFWHKSNDNLGENVLYCHDNNESLLFIYVKCCFPFTSDFGLKWRDQTTNSSETDFVRFCSSIQNQIWWKSHDGPTKSNQTDSIYYN